MISAFAKAVIILAFALLLGLLLTYPVMLGINYVFASGVLMALFGAPTISFWKTYVLLFILGVLFKSHGGSK